MALSMTAVKSNAIPLRSKRIFCHTTLLYRHVHTTPSNHSSIQIPPNGTVSPSDITMPPLLSQAAAAAKATTKSKALPPLSILPTSQILRSYLITRATSTPSLLRASFAILSRMCDPKARFLSPDRNPLLKFAFKHTFYAQFCAGENKAEVQRTATRVNNAGYRGVILEYALELLKGEHATATPAEELRVWRKGMLETVDLANEGDFVALKWSGMGREALALLDAGEPPSTEMRTAIEEVCDRAVERGAALLPGAELEVTNVGIDRWTIDLQRKYNKTRPVMYTTYQCYLKSTPGNVARDLDIARKEGFVAGVKLVRGAYLWSEPRDRVTKTLEETHGVYDGVMEAVLKRMWNDVLKPADQKNNEFPPVAVVLASHNLDSVKKARAIRDEQAEKGEPLIECAFAQLQGMADEISCSLVAASQAKMAEGKSTSGGVEVLKPVKCATWGTVSECLGFLYRRALENQDACARTAVTRKAMASELVRRSKAVVGM
ncbi:proline dehydrogenase [Microthyrium microscopicum]|uniref:Proline dehydrogenase n=1 Tax=Microthyrium microscopicum TaxID=703497 RepID=A0A6A6U2F2_9PEZI|nr:proline dehydrogenase [Microthyrium microscopicum]